MKKALAAVPGAIVAARIGANLWHGVRGRMGLRYTADGVTHQERSVDDAVAYVEDVFSEYLTFAGREPGSVAGQAVLEIGPGDSLGVALLFAGHGARSVTCIDRFRPWRDDDKERRILAELVARARPERAERMRACLDASGLVTAGAIRYWPDVPIEAAGEHLVPAGFDLIVSRAVLQAVRSVDQSYAACRRLLRAGGAMIHKVDLANLSAVERHPLQFLSYGSTLWRWMSSNLSRVNRARASEHRAAMIRHGFAIDRFEVTKLLPAADVESYRDELARQFRELPTEDLATQGFFVLARPEQRG